MNNPRLSRLRALCPPGTRIELTADIQDPYTPIPAGSCGYSQGVDDAGQIMMSWDCGSSLSLLPGDQFKVVRENETGNG